MPGTITSPGEIYIPYGEPNKDTIYFRNPSTSDETKFENWISYKYVKKINHFCKQFIFHDNIDTNERV